MSEPDQEKKPTGPPNRFAAFWDRIKNSKQTEFMKVFLQEHFMPITTDRNMAGVNLVPQEVVDNFDPVRVAFYKEIEISQRDPEQRAARNFVFDIANIQKARQQRYDYYINNIADVLRRVIVNKDVAEAQSILRVMGMDKIEGDKKPTDKEPLKKFIYEEMQKIIPKGPAVVGIPVSGPGAVVSLTYQPVMGVPVASNRDHTRMLGGAAGDYVIKREPEDIKKEREVQYLLENDMNISPLNFKPTNSDRIIFIVGSYFLQVFALMMVEWLMAMNVIAYMSQAVMFYLVAYISLFLLIVFIVALLPIHGSNIAFMFSPNLPGGLLRIIVLLLPYLFMFMIWGILKIKKFENKFKILTISERKQMIRELNKITFVLWGISGALSFAPL